MNTVSSTDTIAKALTSYIATTNEFVPSELFIEFAPSFVLETARDALLEFKDRLASDPDIERRQSNDLSDTPLRELRSKASAIRTRAHNTIKSFPFDHQLIALYAINTFFKDPKVVGYLENKGSNFCKVDKLFSVAETCIRLLRELHGGELTSDIYASRRADVAEKFGMSLNSLDKYISRLTAPEGCDILGSSVQINELRTRVTNYDPSIHPVFLALNLTEVYFLTVELRNLCDGQNGEKTASDIAYDVYDQLSRYGKNMIDALAGSIDFSSTPSGYTPQKGYRKESMDDLVTLKKRLKIQEIAKKRQH